MMGYEISGNTTLFTLQFADDQAVIGQSKDDQEISGRV